MQGKARIGKVSRLHGYKGEVSLKLGSGFEDIFSDLDHIFLEINRKPVPFFIKSLRFTPQGYALVFFEGIDSKSEAERIRGKEIWIDDDFQRIDSDRAGNEDLRGYQVEDESLGTIGEVDETVEHPGNSFLVVNRDDGQILIPTHKDIVKTVDHERKVIHIVSPEGLIELNLD